MKTKWLTPVADHHWNLAAWGYMPSCWILYLRSCKLCIGWMMELCCNAIPWCGVKTYCLFLHSDKKNECLDRLDQLTFSFLYIHNSKLTRDKNLNTFIFISGSSLTQPLCCRRFPFVHAWRGSHHWGGQSTCGPPRTRGFMAGYDRECHVQLQWQWQCCR